MKMRRVVSYAVVLGLIVFLVSISGLPEVSAIGQTKYVTTVYSSGDFKLYYGSVVADIYVDAADYAGVVRAVNDLKSDIATVTGMTPSVENSTAALYDQAIIIGTIGKSPVIDSLISAGKLDVTNVSGKWESFVTQVVSNPVAGVSKGLVIAGSDKRGTIYGIYDLSEQIGVSAWAWWADVKPQHQDTLVVTAGIYKQGEPSVKYRGIFINDESNFKNWSKLNMDAGKNIGPNTYKKVFELLLRLKANFMWPAMHPYTDEFNKYPENAQNADMYGIVMGSSHCEMILRNNVKEWGPWSAAHNNATYDYSVNPTVVYDYWDYRAQTNAAFESGFSIGMRGIHDDGFTTANCDTTAEKVALMETIFADQRTILRNRVNSDLTKVLQVFTPYKEVLDLYNAGLQVPDDAVMVWAEDNHGYIRQLPTAAERLRSGGAGIYYHVSYWGSPKSYLWINTTPLALIWEEMNKAYDYNAKNLWVVNVGDIKPSEISLEFLMNYAWNVNKWNETNIRDFIVAFAERDFGPAYKNEIADLMMSYYQYGIACRPEFMDKGKYNCVNYGDEGQKRVDQYAKLLEKADAVYNSLPADLKDAFYEMVLYPVRASYLTVKKFVYAEKSDLYKNQGRGVSVNICAEQSRAAYDTINADLSYYNNTLAGGKWKNIINPFNSEVPTITGMPAVSSLSTLDSNPVLGVVIEGQVTGNETTTLKFSAYTQDKRFIDIFNKGGNGFDWTASKSAAWILLSKSSGRVNDDERVWASIDWANAPAGDSTGTITINGASAAKVVNITVSNPASPTRASVDGYIEANGYVSIEAEHYYSKVDRGGSTWKVVKGLGRSGDSVKVFPNLSDSITANINTTSPELQYKIYFFSTGTFPVTVYRIPTLNTIGAVRYAIGFDNNTPVVVSGANSTSSSGWSTNVLEGIEKLTTNLTISTAGYHTLKLWKVDPAIAVDKIVINTGGLLSSYLGPPESYNSQFITTPEPTATPTPTPAATLTALPTPTPTTAGSFWVEAENMSLTNYTAESNSYASGGNCIKCPSGTGTASYTFSGIPGTYDLVIAYFDENDGVDTYKLYVNSTVVDQWTANQNYGSANPDGSTLTSRTKTGVAINSNDLIKIEGTVNTYEYCRVDKIDFIKRSSGTPTPTPTPGVTMVVDDNFNNGTVGAAPSGWTAALNGSGTVTVEAVPSASDKSVKVYKNVGANDTKAIKTFSAQNGIVTVELKARADSTTAYYCLPYINASNGTRAISVAFDGGNIKSYIGGTLTTIQSFTAGTWYDLKIVINTDTDTYDLYINGVQKKSGVSLRNPVSNIGVIECYIGVNNTGTLYFDNVKVYK